ncbi:carboxy terminal-processing peptidase [Chitinophagaceae bacterium LWZ2-11]
MMRRKGSILLCIVVFAAIFFAFRSIHNNGLPVSQKQRLLETIGVLLTQQHYSPKTIDDAFSKQIFKKYLEELDGDKSLFLQSDINSLKKYETTIDDEILGATEIKFAPAVGVIYEKRLAEVTALYKELLSKPFDFKADESLQVDAEKLNYLATEADRKDRWRKRLKYLVLERYVSAQEDRDKSTVDSVKSKTNEMLEKDSRDKVLKALDRTYNRIKLTLTEDERFNLFINVITNLMDPHTDYFPPVEKRAFDEQMSGRFYGIGAQLTEADGYVKIASVMPGGAAFKSGEIMVGDAIAKVAQGKTGEFVDITGYAIEDAVKLIRGDKGTEVRLTLKKADGTFKVVSIMRDEIVLDETFARSVIIQKDSKRIGYIYLPDFYADFERPDGAKCSEDVAKEIVKLKDEKVDGIILDIRLNGGGSLYEVKEMVGFFVGQGPVVQVRDRDGKVSVLSDDSKAPMYDGPFAVMVNETSASASEIFAAAIQDYKRGIIVGSTSTYGKGTVQRNVPLGKPVDFFSGRTEYGAVKLTFQKFYRVNGGSTQLKGVTPDVVLPDPYEYLKIREKDNPSSLPWDEIAKAPIKAFSGYDDVIAKAKERIKTDSAFSGIKSNTDFFAKKYDEPVNLQIDKYKEQQKLTAATSKQSNNLMKLKNEMTMDFLKADNEKFYNNPDKAKQTRYQAWLKDKKTDIYIDQTVKIVTDMITAQATGTALK